MKQFVKSNDSSKNKLAEKYDIYHVLMIVSLNWPKFRKNKVYSNLKNPLRNLQFFLLRSLE